MIARYEPIRTVLTVLGLVYIRIQIVFPTNLDFFLERLQSEDTLPREM